MSEAKRKWWLISLRGYDEIGFYGTDSEADDSGAISKQEIPAVHRAARISIKNTEWEFENGFRLSERALASIGQTAIERATP